MSALYESDVSYFVIYLWRLDVNQLEIRLNINSKADKKLS